MAKLPLEYNYHRARHAWNTVSQLVASCCFKHQALYQERKKQSAIYIHLWRFNILAIQANDAHECLNKDKICNFGLRSELIRSLQTS
eukprot:scaffold314638_cov20-Prasinocladus_malaysianus.AAC.1